MSSSPACQTPCLIRHFALVPVPARSVLSFQLQHASAPDQRILTLTYSLRGLIPAIENPGVFQQHRPASTPCVLQQYAFLSDQFLPRHLSFARKSPSPAPVCLNPAQAWLQQDASTSVHVGQS